MTQLLPVRRNTRPPIVGRLAGVALLGLAMLVTVDAAQGGSLDGSTGTVAGGLEALLYRLAAVLVLVGLGGLLLAPEPRKPAAGRLIE